MNAPAVVWDPSVPAEMRALAEPILAAALPLAPSWCHRIVVDWKDSEKSDEGHAVAWMEPVPHYREAYLTLTGAWVAQTPVERHEMLRHEVLHLPLGPMGDVFHRALAAVKKADPSLAKELKAQWFRAQEGAVSDLSAATAPREEGA